MSESSLSSRTMCKGTIQLWPPRRNTLLTYHPRFLRSPIKISTAGWIFVFAVNLSMSGVDPNSAAGKAIAAQIDNPGDYSISRLYADFMSKHIQSLLYA